MELFFRDKLMLGVASSATQVEGGHSDHSWNDWFEKGKISDGSSPTVADDHWTLWKQDIDLMATMGISYYRFGLEWARIQPKENVVDQDAIAHYRAEISYMLEKGIRPLMTIHHFTNPMWFENKGAFLNKENLPYFLNFVELTVKAFGDLVEEYITINEPNVYATNGYCFGAWPPGRTSYLDTFRVLSNLSYCHIEAYAIIHRLRKQMGYTGTMVGFANHVRVFDPLNNRSCVHRVFAKAADWLFQGAITKASCLGKFQLPLINHWHVKPGEYADFIGLNYYTRSTVSGLKDGTKANSPVNDLGWEIYPEGIVRCAEQLWKVLGRPIWITENGTCDRDDRFRSKYIYEHLAAIVASDLPIERYYHWCFTDNFEWLEGESARFGLVHVDYRTQERTIKKAGRFYQEMIRNHGVSEELYGRYVQEEFYSIN